MDVTIVAILSQEVVGSVRYSLVDRLSARQQPGKWQVAKESRGQPDEMIFRNLFYSARKQSREWLVSQGVNLTVSLF